jgi:methionyl-tRNA formyltransferase
LLIFFPAPSFIHITRFGKINLMKAVKIAFFGTPLLARVCLEALHHTFGVSLVVTKADKECGRGRKITCNPVKEYALANGIDVRHYAKGGEEIFGELKKKKIELSVVVAYGKILPTEVIEAPPYGSLNLHASMLPKYRGPSPLVAAILEGEKKTGITLQKMHRRIDAGDIILQREVAIEAEDSAGDLLKRITAISPGFLLEGIRGFVSGTLAPRPQNESQATYCTMIGKEAGLIDWSETARTVVNRIRAYNPWPVAYTFLEGKTLRIFKARRAGRKETEDGEYSGEPGTIVGVDKTEGILALTGEGTVGIRELQLENRRCMTHREFVCGFKELVGKVLKNQP